MKIAPLVMLPALLFACYGATHAQMPGYPMPGGAYPGRPTNFADPMPAAAAGPAAPGQAMMANPMGAAPAHPEALSGADGGFGGQDAYGTCGPAGTVTAACGYGYIQVDALYWERRNGTDRQLINASLDPTVQFINGGNLNYNFEVLPRLTGGYVMANGIAIEGTYFYKDDFASRTGVGGPANIDNVTFGDPLPGSSFDAADWGGVNASTKLQNAEINFVETERFFNFLLGFRYMEIQELTQVLTAGVNIGEFNMRTYNRLLGGQGGMRVAHTWGLLGLEAQGKAGLYFNDASSSTAVNDPLGLGNFNLDNGGQNEAFLGEIQVMATIRTHSAWQYRIGYNAMWINEVALATDNVRNSFQTGAALNAKSDLFFHGPFAGAEFRW